MAKPKSLDLRVTLDTNALYTGSASYFIRREVADLIEQHRALPDLRISWYLPSVVRDERHFQMLAEASKFLEPVAKLERLLGHNLNITPDILDLRVRETIEKQIAEYDLTILPFDSSTVDWHRLISDAAFRRPPFQTGDKEKGFRDAIILESFLQLQTSAPTSATSCRLVLVTNDELLRTAAAERTDSAANVHILDSIDALKGLISTLGSAVDESFIADIVPKAERIFYIPNDEDTLYYKWGIHQTLTTTLNTAAVALPALADRYTVDKWSIARPRFLKKQGQRLSWVSRFSARIKATRDVRVTKWQQPSNIVLPSSGSTLVFGAQQPSAFSLPSTYNLQPWVFSQPPEGGSYLDPVINYPQESPVATGTATLDVTWTVSVTTRHALKSPQLDSCTFVDAVWD